MNHKQIFIKDLKPNMQVNDEIFAVEAINIHKTRNGDPYYRLTLQDKTGDIGARIWQDYFPYCNIKDLKPGKVVAVDFETTEYNGKLQMVITRLRILNEGDYILGELIQSSDKDIDTMWEKFNRVIDSVENPHIKQLLKNIFSDPDIAERFKYSPAAEKVHHDFIGGLLEHTLEVLRYALTIAKDYPQADKDIVIAGAMLHDIGKIYELGIEKASVIRTKVGYLIGHITLGVELILKYMPDDFPEELKVAILHIVLSHHTELEYGAVVKPATIEAAIVAMADVSSSTVRQFQKEITTKKPDELGFGQYHPFLGTKIYFGEKQNKIKEEM